MLVIFIGALFAVSFVIVLVLRKKIPRSEIILPALLLAALAAGEFAAGIGLIPIPPTKDRPPDRTWQIPIHTDLLGNQEARRDFEFRGRVHRRKKEGSRLVCLGSSSTFGAGLKAGEIPYPLAMEEALRRLCPSRRVDVVNAGLTGYHSFQLLILLKEVLRFLEPDLVTFYYGVNEGLGVQAKVYYARARGLVDLRPGLSPRERRLMLKYGTGNRGFLFLSRILNRSRLVAAIKPALSAAAQGRYRARLRRAGLEVAPDSGKILDGFRALAEERGFQLILIPECSAKGGVANPRYAELMRVAAASTSVAYMDMCGVFPEAPARFFLDDIHMNEEGHELFGRALAERLCPRL